MAIRTVFNKKVVLPNFDFSKKYWPIVTEEVEKEIAGKEIKDAAVVEELLKRCFSKLCQIFEEKIAEQKKVSFFICCQYLHEDSIDLWQLQTQGVTLPIDEEDFAAARKSLKIILEQSTKLDLTGSPDFIEELKQNTEKYVEIIEELLYIGHWCLLLSEYTARCQLFPKSMGLKMEASELVILTYQPYPALFKYIFEDIPKHNSHVALSDSIGEFKDIIKDNFNIGYDDLSNFILQQEYRPAYRFSLTLIEPLIETLIKETNCDEEFVRSFYAGLTVNKENCLSVEKCIYNNQDLNRHIYRPILELTVDGKKHNIIGFKKWMESFTTLTTNCFPFGLYPIEWQKFPQIKAFIQKVDNTHDKILQDPVEKILNDNKILNEIDIASFDQGNGTNINITNTVGDIDILFLDRKYKIIYVCESKHNRSRFDLNNWRRDYANFKEKYEKQLDRKVDWATHNKKVIETHFKNKFGGTFNESLDDYDIRGIFIINAPTLYMYNGRYRAFTIYDISKLVTTGYIDVKFELTSETTGKTYLIEHPYFDDVEKKFND
ncbi:MAG: hypothetical protein M0D53_12475 [Flavobacterium sp. JAD_PAG50586_2]|nr:MAG: hypothetical protein M0D53_12475 [Flavobacterium sp. JAD_PAG50586_2]